MTAATAQFASGFGLADVRLFRMSVSISEPNFAGILNPLLRYNYFRFGETDVRHIGIRLPVSPWSAFYSAPTCQITSKSENPGRSYVISVFKMAAAKAQF